MSLHKILISLWRQLHNRLRYGCTHHHVGWPIRGKQRCLDCGRWRTWHDGDGPEYPPVVGTVWYQDRYRPIPGQRAREIGEATTGADHVQTDLQVLRLKQASVEDWRPSCRR